MNRIPLCTTSTGAFIALFPAPHIWKTALATLLFASAAWCRAADCTTLADATHAPALDWTTGGDAPWFAQTSVVRTADSCAAQSGMVSNQAASWIQTEVAGNGLISFIWKVSSEEGGDYLRFRINGAHRYQMSGEVDWQERQYEVAGVSTLRWEYVKDANTVAGDDSAWMTDLSFQPFTGRFVQATGELEFGRVETGGSAEKTIHVANRGDEPLTVSGISLPEHFSAAPSNFTLAAGETSAVTVAFATLADGVFTGFCSVVSDAQNGGATIPVSGEGFTRTHRYVWTNSPAPAAPFTNWTTAAHAIQDALDACRRDDVVWVTNGVYDAGGAFGLGQTNRMVVSTGIVVRSMNGPAVTHIVGAADPSATHALGLGPAAVRGVLLMTNSVLDGFTVRGGRSSVDGYGGGIASETASLRRSNPFGLYADLPLGRVTNCVITDNAARVGGGTAFVYADGCVVESNAAWSGGGMAYSLANNCLVRGNVAESEGGGMAQSLALGCRIVGNRAADGGGIYFNRMARNCVVAENSASGSGGGVMAGDWIESSTIVGNHANHGGGLWQVKAINCVVAHNSAIFDADYSASGALVSCVATTNGTADSIVGTLFADPRIVSLADPHLLPGSPAIDAGTNQVWMADSTDVDGEPRLEGSCMDVGADEFRANGLADALHVAVNLPQGGQAVPGYAIPFQADILGRCQQTRWDMGDGTVLANEAVFRHAFAATGDYAVTLSASNLLGETSATVTVRVWNAAYYVATNGSDAADGLSWATARRTLQAAVEACTVPGGTIWASNGTYDAGGQSIFGLSNRVLVARPVTLRSLNGPAVTIIAGARDPDSTNSFGFGANAVRGVALQQGATLAGFTVAGGRTLAESDDERYSGPALIFQIAGGGVWCDSYAETVTNCVITNCAAKDFGGGAWRGQIMHATLRDNESGMYGGGSYDSHLSHCLIESNRSVYGGGGLFNGEAIHSLFLGNSSMGGGAAAFNSHLKNCTVVRNSSGILQGSAVNCILYGNAGGNWGTLSSTNYRHTCTVPLPDGAGCFTNDPMLSSDYSLAAASPCVNAGTNEPGMDSATDFAGNPRIRNAVVDVGAFESDGWGMFADVDRDGYADWTEVNVLGTDPTNAASFLGMMDLGFQGSETAGMVVRWQSVAGKLYNVERATNLTENPAFTNWMDGVAGLPDSTTVTDATATAESPCFYRVEIAP